MFEMSLLPGRSRRGINIILGFCCQLVTDYYVEDHKASLQSSDALYQIGCGSKRISFIESAQKEYQSKRSLGATHYAVVLVVDAALQGRHVACH